MEECVLENLAVAQCVEKFLASIRDRMFIHKPAKFKALYSIS
jgi:hypothetical protein